MLIDMVEMLKKLGTSLLNNEMLVSVKFTGSPKLRFSKASVRKLLFFN